MLPSQVTDHDPNPWLVLSLAVACGVTVANIYYAQPLIGPIGLSFGIGVSSAGLIVTMLQIGYVLGLLLLAPLGDLVENRLLILITLGDGGAAPPPSRRCAKAARGRG